MGDCQYRYAVEDADQQGLDRGDERRVPRGRRRREENILNSVVSADTGADIRKNAEEP